VQPVRRAENPFALLLTPADVVVKKKCSERRHRLHSRIFRPLDKAVDTVRIRGVGSDEFGQGDRYLRSVSPQARPAARKDFGTFGQER
jgi:hypothetical protein